MKVGMFACAVLRGTTRPRSKIVIPRFSTPNLDVSQIARGVCLRLQSSLLLYTYKPLPTGAPLGQPKSNPEATNMARGRVFSICLTKLQAKKS